MTYEPSILMTAYDERESVARALEALGASCTDGGVGFGTWDLEAEWSTRQGGALRVMLNGDPLSSSVRPNDDEDDTTAVYAEHASIPLLLAYLRGVLPTYGVTLPDPECVSVVIAVENGVVRSVAADAPARVVILRTDDVPAEHAAGGDAQERAGVQRIVWELDARNDTPE